MNRSDRDLLVSRFSTKMSIKRSVKDAASTDFYKESALVISPPCNITTCDSHSTLTKKTYTNTSVRRASRLLRNGCGDNEEVLDANQRKKLRRIDEPSRKNESVHKATATLRKQEVKRKKGSPTWKLCREHSVKLLTCRKTKNNENATKPFSKSGQTEAEYLPISNPIQQSSALPRVGNHAANDDCKTASKTVLTVSPIMSHMKPFAMSKQIRKKPVSLPKRSRDSLLSISNHSTMKAFCTERQAKLVCGAPGAPPSTPLNGKAKEQELQKQQVNEAKKRRKETAQLMFYQRQVIYTLNRHMAEYEEKQFKDFKMSQLGVAV